MNAVLYHFYDKLSLRKSHLVCGQSYKASTSVNYDSRVILNIYLAYIYDS